MSRSAFLLIALALVFALTPVVEAQSPEMPEPLAIVVDADGKPMVQVIDIGGATINVLFDFDGTPAMFELNYDHNDFESQKSIYFSQDNCQGDVFMNDNLVSVLDRMHNIGFAIKGPDANTGTYRVFRSTSVVPGVVHPESQLDFGNSTLGFCADIATGYSIVLIPAEEILPNPLEGFHGPTVANPERSLTVKGGTRLP